MWRIRPDRPSLGRPVDTAHRGTLREGAAMPSLVASFVAIGFAGSMVAAPSAALAGAPVLAGPPALVEAPVLAGARAFAGARALAGAPCTKAENYAAQAGAESVRIDRLKVGSAAGAG